MIWFFYLCLLLLLASLLPTRRPSDVMTAWQRRQIMRDRWRRNPGLRR